MGHDLQSQIYPQSYVIISLKLVGLLTGYPLLTLPTVHIEKLNDLFLSTMYFIILITGWLSIKDNHTCDK